MSSSESTTDEIKSAILRDLAAGKKLEDIHSGLVQKGMDEGLSTQVVKKIATDVCLGEKAHWDKKLKSAGILFGIGTAITLGTLALAEGGGIYLLAWGPILFGIIRGVEAFINSEKLKAKLALAEKFGA
jgi:hypothetical protein